MSDTQDDALDFEDVMKAREAYVNEGDNYRHARKDPADAIAAAFTAGAAWNAARRVTQPPTCEPAQPDTLDDLADRLEDLATDYAPEKQAAILLRRAVAALRDVKRGLYDIPSWR
jgi:hypothetical protein